jgi:nucleotide-binding universal stress UspA family protein
MVRAHERCPYSRAVRGNVEVTLTVDGTALEARWLKTPETKPGLPTRLLVGLDGSVGSTHALAWAVELATALGAEILATHVFQLTSTLVAYGLAPIVVPDQWLADLRQQVENEWAAPLKQGPVRYRTIIEPGIPAPTLIGIAEREHADLIAVGSRGLGGLGELLLGSVSHQLVMHAPVPAVVIPAEHRKVKEAAKTVGEPATIPVRGVAAPS